jgi:hypothetical protein
MLCDEKRDEARKLLLGYVTSFLQGLLTNYIQARQITGWTEEALAYALQYAFEELGWTLGKVSSIRDSLILFFMCVV